MTLSRLATAISSSTLSTASGIFSRMVCKVDWIRLSKLDAPRTSPLKDDRLSNFEGFVSTSEVAGSEATSGVLKTEVSGMV